MYILWNSIKNLGRNKGRNILMAVIIFVIIVTTVTALIINTTTAAIIKDYKARFGTEIFIEFDFDNIQDYNKEYANITNQQQIEFGESTLLQSAVFRSEIAVAPQGLKGVDVDENASSHDSTLEATALVYGTSRDDISDDFKNGLRKIVQGEMYKEQNECLISEQYAKLNNLSVGDTINVNSIFKDNPMPHQLTITGIYSDNTMLSATKTSNTNESRNNEIIVSIDTAISMEMFNENGYLLSTYYLKDPSLLEDFHKELTGKGLPEYYKVTADEEGYNQVVGPVEGLAKISVTFMIVVLIMGSLILMLLSTLAIRERKYEIGVLRAMGMKKGKVALGLLSEMFIITIACLIIGIGAGAAVSQPVADSLLKNQIEIAEENQNKNQEGNYEVAGNSPLSPTSLTHTPLSELSVSLTGEAVLQIILISLLIAVVSSLMGIVYITKYEPIKILSERN